MESGKSAHHTEYQRKHLWPEPRRDRPPRFRNTYLHSENLSLSTTRPPPPGRGGGGRDKDATVLALQPCGLSSLVSPWTKTVELQGTASLPCLDHPYVCTTIQQEYEASLHKHLLGACKLGRASVSKLLLDASLTNPEPRTGRGHLSTIRTVHIFAQMPRKHPPEYRRPTNNERTGQRILAVGDFRQSPRDGRRVSVASKQP